MNGTGEGPGLPRYSVSELNAAVGSLLERGFAPRFLLEATVSRPQLKKGHLWMTLVDDQASITAVVWASQLPRLSLQPSEGDGVLVVGKLNFWASRASLSVQVLDLRPSLSSVLRRFEQVRQLLHGEGLFAPERKRALPRLPQCIALLTSVPSSALADMLRTAAERWPATRILVVPIPVQGAVEGQICATLTRLYSHLEIHGIEAIVLARGGGSREDLTVFDGADLARVLAASPVPIVSGIGHEDDTTIADLVADHRAATPTAALVALLPERAAVLAGLAQAQRHLAQLVTLRLQGERQQLGRLEERLSQLHPRDLLDQRRTSLRQAQSLLRALSPDHILRRGFSLIRLSTGPLVRSVQDLHPDQAVVLELADGQADALVRQIHPQSPPPAAPA
jgi:exodeoxyribonuclease VII large subunit